MGTSATVAAVLRTQGVQFVRLLQSAVRLVMIYSSDHSQAHSLTQRAMAALEEVLKQTPTLSVGFQFDRVLLNSLPVADPSLSPLAAELTKRGVGFLVFSEGLTESGLSKMISVLATRPEAIQEQGGLPRFLRVHPLEHARIVPIQTAAADGSLAVVTSAEEAAAMSKVPRWLLRVLHEVEAVTETPIVGPQELASLGESFAAELTPEQRLLLPQLQELLVRVVQRANTAALSELIRAASMEIGAASEELLQSILLQGLIKSAQAGELPQAERILRTMPQLRMEPESLLQMVPKETVSGEVRQGLFDYAVWLARPMADRLEEMKTSTSTRESRWLVLEMEHLCQEGRIHDAADLLLVLFSTRGPEQEVERAEIFTRGRHLLAEVCADGLPFNAESILEVISTRLREENSVPVSTPLIESLVVFTQTAAQKDEFPLAIAGAGVVEEIGEEFSPRGRIARQAQSRLIKQSTLRQLVRTCITRKDDPTVSRMILPLLKRVGDQAARELLDLMEKEPMAPRRLRILTVVKVLGRSAAEALADKIADPQWYVVRNAVVALAELADPALLGRLEPALCHPDERVQQAAVNAALKTQSSLRGLPLARALLFLKPAVLETVLDDLVVLKEPQAVPYLEKLLRQSGKELRLHLAQKAVAALWAVGTEDTAHALLNCANDTALGLPLRQATVRALARLDLPAARQSLEDFVRTTPEAALAEEGRKLLGA